MKPYTYIKTPKHVETFENTDERGEYFVTAKNVQPVSAYEYLCIDYPHCRNKYTVENAHLIRMRECLDCKSSWIGDECGNCGEARLSKREKEYYHFY